MTKLLARSSVCKANRHAATIDSAAVKEYVGIFIKFSILLSILAEV